jgi:hypothetical protein
VSQGEALLLSLLLELPLVLAISALLAWVPRARLGHLLLVGASATLLTHPFAWHGFGIIRGLVPDYWARAVLIEGGVAVVEGLLYSRLMTVGWARGQVLGWVANAFSFGLGLVIMERFYR